MQNNKIYQEKQPEVGSDKTAESKFCLTFDSNGATKVYNNLQAADSTTAQEVVSEP
jgi:hypothetical protein